MAIGYRLTSTALPTTAEVRAIRGVEKISEPYTIEVCFSVHAGEIVDLKAAAGERGTLTLDIDSLIPLQFQGIFRSVELVHADQQLSYYLATLAPRLWQLTRSHHSRIFTDNSIPEIIEATLLHEGMSAAEFRFELSHGYPQLEHVCQYRESSLDFVSRLMEREGMYYYFEHGSDNEVMVITDHNGVHESLLNAPIKYYPEVGSGSSQLDHAISRFRSRAQVVSRNVHLHDYDYNKPQVELTGDATVGNYANDIVIYGENFQSTAIGQRYAAVHAEALKAEELIYEGRGAQSALRSGYLMTLEDHPHMDLNQEYLVTEVHHLGSITTSDAAIHEIVFGESKLPHYQVEIRLIESATQYRPQRKTAWPRVDSVVDAVVCGAAGGPYAEIDDQGRYKVRVLFDESDLIDGSSSTWVRMAQPHGGPGMGMHFPLRKDTEVLLSFLNGDPDRPLIAGVAHNVTQPSYVTSGNHTQNYIYTGGGNYLLCEDNAGAQYTTIYSPIMNSIFHAGAVSASRNGTAMPGNITIRTDGNAYFKFVGWQEVHVDQTLLEIVEGNVEYDYNSELKVDVEQKVTVDYHDTYDLTVDNKVTILYDNLLDFDVMGGAIEDYQGPYRRLTVHGHHHELFKQNHYLTVDGNSVEAVKGTTHIDYHQDYDFDCFANTNITVDGTQTEHIKSPVTENYDDTVTQTFGGQHTWTVQDNFVGNVTGDYTLTVAGAYTVNQLSKSWFETSINGLAGKLDVTGLKLDIALTGVKLGLALTGVDFDISATGVKGELTAAGVKIHGDWTGLDLDLNPGEQKIDVPAVQIQMRVLNVSMHAIKIVL